MTDPERLLRRTFAAHESDADPAALRRIAAAMSAPPVAGRSVPHQRLHGSSGPNATAPSRRWRPLLAGLAAGLAIVAVLVGSFGRSDDREPVPASTISEPIPLPSRPGELSATDRGTLLDRLDAALQRRGTLSVRMNPVSGTPATVGGHDRGVVFELDVRDPAVTRWRAGGTSQQIGDEFWRREEVRPGVSTWQRRSPPRFAKHGRALLGFMWAPEDRDRVVVLSTERADDRPLVHYQFVATRGDDGRPLPADTGKDDGRGRLDLWVAPDGTITRASMRHDFDEWRADPITYGADVTITPPAEPS